VLVAGRADRLRCFLDPLQVIAAGIIGGILGDAASFWLGQKFGGALLKLWPFRGNPDRVKAESISSSVMGTIGVALGCKREPPGPRPTRTKDGPGGLYPPQPLHKIGAGCGVRRGAGQIL
jgi:hypothetical protein